MKTNSLRYIYSIGFLLFLVACSTKRDSFLSRNSHALSTKYNILYNGQVGLDKGIVGIKENNKDNFWKRLPIERMQINEEFTAEGKPKNADFELAETKATKAIQKHSMNIEGRERNSQIDEAYLLLGKSRYYDQRFIPALDAFNYILYKYPNSSKIYEAKIWREKTNMRLGNDALVVKNISKLLKEKSEDDEAAKTKKSKDKKEKGKKMKRQVLADANALLAESFLNLEKKDSALITLKLAEKYTKKNTERARYRFILGQLYQELGKKDSAIYSYESVIAMNRKAERKYIIQAYSKKAQLFDYKNGDTTAFLKTYNKLIADRENKPFLDLIYREMAVFYNKNGKEKTAVSFYNKSLKKATTDQYLIASDYKDLGNMYFKKANYPLAAKYYDSTLVKLDAKTREYAQIQKNRKDLDEVIKLEAIAQANDSIINVTSLSEKDRVAYFENYIVKLKKSDEAKKVLEEKLKAKQENIARNSKSASEDPDSPDQAGKPKKSMLPPNSTDAPGQQTNVFYFYNPTTLAFGKLEFKKVWGERSSNGNWRVSASKTNLAINDATTEEGKKEVTTDDKSVADKPIEKYTTEYYLKQLPKEKSAIDSIVKERDFAYYQLGVIYKEKFKEYELASSKLEQLLKNNPEEKWVLPALYNLYKIYQITDASKAEIIKNRIAAEFPNSRYAQIVNNKSSDAVAENETPETVYNKWYKLYEEGQYSVVLEKIDTLITQYSGDGIVSKYELLKANTIAKLKGLTAYKNALQHVADNYPNSEEGKSAKEILTNQIPLLEKMSFSTKESKNWKIFYTIPIPEDRDTHLIEEKINKYIADNNVSLFYSCDNYTEKESFITIHGINSEESVKAIVKTLQEDKKYKITQEPIVISSENYKVIQIKKNLDAYLTPKKE